MRESGLKTIDIPELGEKTSGKVRDMWRVNHKDLGPTRVLVTSDRQSAFDRYICTVPDKGKVLNLSSAHWFYNTADIVSNHVISVPHPNVIIAREAVKTIPVEVIIRRYMAKSSTRTSVYFNYHELGRREIYGISFPEGLKGNQELPMGTIITPTTKAEKGHDEELTVEKAREIVDRQHGEGVWDQISQAAINVFERGRQLVSARGLILVDTKYEFGFDQDDNLMLIDEVHTPDSSRFWLSESYKARFKKGETPQQFDKEILRSWLSERGFTGEGEVPPVSPEIIVKMSEAYKKAYFMVTGQQLPIHQPDGDDIPGLVIKALNL